jgi:hypothetical protein
VSAFSDLLNWLEYTGLENLDTSDTQQMLTEALDELKAAPTDTNREALFMVHMVLTQMRSDQDPLPGLRFLLDRYRRVEEAEDEPVCLVMEREIREAAGRLTEAEWNGGVYPLLVMGIQGYLSGNTQALQSILQQLDKILVSAWEPYVNMPVTEEEITAETVVGHCVLHEGFDCWFRALDEVELAASEGRGFEQALKLAEDGSRLLVAVQMTD